MGDVELQREVEALRLRLAELEAAGEARFRVMIEHGSDVTTLTSREGLIVYSSPAMTALSGFAPDELVGKAFLQMVHPDDRPRVTDAMATVRTRPLATCQVDARIVRKDGALRWVSATGTNLLDDPAVGAIVGNLRDVTERRAIEDAQHRLEEQARQVHKMEAMARLASGIAHDFNNILSVIMGYASLLVEATVPGEAMHSDLVEVRKASERGAELTRQLLAFSRHQTLQPRAVDLSATVLGMERILRRVLGDGVELSLLAGKAVGHVYADQGQLEQVLLNLVLNARDSMPHGGKLSVETSNVALDEGYAAEHLGVLPGAYVVLSVTDTGVGMDEETRARVFDPFFTTKPVERSGLGLAVAFGFVQQSGGHIDVVSEPGCGTSFNIYLPCADRPADPAPPRQEEVAASRGSETILLVDDDEQVRTVARAVLRRQGYNVLEAQNGGEAFLVCEQYPARIHLLLTDVVMPRMGGRQLAARIVPLRPGIKVLFMSGYTDRSVVPRELAEAGSLFLQKPLTPGALLAMVREVLDGPANHV